MAVSMDRLESLMDSFYGMDEDNVQADAHNIDSAGFNVAETAVSTLSTSSLPELMSTCARLGDEVREKDRKMQELVYNNYNKFIAATDTIKRMKDSVADMQARMDTLSTRMRAMGGSSALVNANLSENRSKIEKLIGIKRLLLKLAFLFELPVRLQRSIQLDAPAQAVSYYCMVNGVLRKYDHIPSLHKIRVEADAIMNGLKNDLRALLKEGGPSSKASAAAGGVSTGRVVEAISMLVQLEEPRPALRTAYLALQRSKLLGTLKSFAARYAPVLPASATASAAAATTTTTAPAASGADGTSLLSQRAQAIYKSSLETAAASAATAAAGGRAPMASPRPRAAASAYTFMQSLNRAFLDVFKSAAEHYVELFEESETADATPGAGSAPGGPEERRAAHEQLLTFAKDVLGEYFSLVRSQLSLPPPPAGTDSTPSAAAPDKSHRAAASAAGSSAASRKAAAVNPFSAPVAGDDVDVEEAAAQAKAAALAAAAALTEKHSDGRFGHVIDALNLFLMDVRSAERHVREASMKDRAHEVTEAVIRAQLEGLFADVRGDVVHLLGTLQTTSLTLVEEERGKAVRAAAGLAPDAPADAPADSGATPGGSSANPFGTAAVSAAAAAVAAVPSSSTAAATGRYDWLHTVGAGLSAAAEQASVDVSRRLDEALHESKPLLLSGIRQLPDLAHIFNALLNGQVLNMLMWLASAWEALGDPFHPCRTEFADVVVTADLGLERELMRTGRGGASAAAGRAGAAGRASAAAAGNHSVLKRRVAVNFAAAEADSGGAVARESYASGAALLNVERDPAFLLLLAHLCRHFSSNGVTHALDTMLKSLPSRADLQAIGVRFGDNEVEAFGSMADVPDLIKRMQGAGRELLRRYAYQHATRLSLVVRRAMTSEDWLAHGEPRNVRVVVQLVLEDVAQIKKLAACTLGDWDARSANALAAAFGIGHDGTPAAATPATGVLSVPGGNSNPFAAPTGPVSLRGGPALAGAAPGSLSAAQAARRTGLIVGAAGLSGGFGALNSLSSFGGATATGARGLHMDIERLFRNGGGDAGVARIVLGAVDYSSSSLVRVLLRVLFKTWAEWSRDCSFGKGGYQQMQVDIAAVHLALPYFTARQAPPVPGAASAAAVSAYDPYEGATQLEELLNEVVVSAADRCSEPAALESTIVYSLATAYAKKLNFAL